MACLQQGQLARKTQKAEGNEVWVFPFLSPVKEGMPWECRSILGLRAVCEDRSHSEDGELVVHCFSQMCGQSLFSVVLLLACLCPHLMVSGLSAHVTLCLLSSISPTDTRCPPSELLH